MERLLLEQGCGSLMVSTVGRREFEPTVGRRDYFNVVTHGDITLYFERTKPKRRPLTGFHSFLSSWYDGEINPLPWNLPQELDEDDKINNFLQKLIGRLI
eukprot:scaffold2552_cov172-Alexandrium_tamarense.AAC.22